jgi:hypothetical protein
MKLTPRQSLGLGFAFVAGVGLIWFLVLKVAAVVLEIAQ